MNVYVCTRNMNLMVVLQERKPSPSLSLYDILNFSLSPIFSSEQVEEGNSFTCLSLLHSYVHSFPLLHFPLSIWLLRRHETCERERTFSRASTSTAFRPSKDGWGNTKVWSALFSLSVFPFLPIGPLEELFMRILGRKYGQFGWKGRG